jgi:hypothetical protein
MTLNDNGKCEKCGLTEEFIADNKVVNCRGKIRNIPKNEKSVKPKTFI